MKSLRLKIRKHSKSRKLRSRKHSKGGNGDRYNSRNKNYIVLRTMIDEIKTLQDKIWNEEEEPNDEVRLNQVINLVILKFNENRITLARLNDEERYDLFEAIIGFIDFRETDKKIITAYANAYLTQNANIDWMTELLKLEIKDKKQHIEKIKRNEDENGHYETEEDKAEGIIVDERQIENIEIILNIITIHEDSLMVNAIRAVKRGEEPGSVSKNSNHIGLPDPAFENVITNLHGPNYKYRAKNPKQYETVLSNAVENIKKTPSREEKSSSSSSALGGRRTRRRKTRRRTRRRK